VSDDLAVWVGRLASTVDGLLEVIEGNDPEYVNAAMVERARKCMAEFEETWPLAVPDV
jgi:hypothetical protein